MCAKLETIWIFDPCDKNLIFVWFLHGCSLKAPAIASLANVQMFKFCCEIQGSHLIGYLWVSLIIDQSECLICYFLCTELTLFCTELTLFCIELPENYIYLNQSELSNFSMYIIKETIDNFARGPCYHLFKRYVFVVLAKMRTETKTVPSTWYIFVVSRSHHINLPP